MTLFSFCIFPVPLTFVLHYATRYLAERRVPEAATKARRLVLWSSGLSLLKSIKYPETLIEREALHRLETALSRCAAGESVYRIIGEREFYGLNFTLSVDTLEPRPDTETLIDLVLPFLQECCQKKKLVSGLDMGTGSGAIAIVLLTHVPRLHVIGVDNMKGALVTAVENARRAGVAERFIPHESNWFTTIKGRFDLVISNPPYIPERDIANLDKTVRDYDPFCALNGGKDGLYFYHILAKEGHHYLVRNGRIAVEVGNGQSKIVSALFLRHGYKKEKEKNDLSGTVRALMFSCKHKDKNSYNLNS